MNSSNKLVTLFIFLAVLAGALILFIPVQKLLVLFIGFIILVLLIKNPKYCFFLMLLLSTYVPPFQTESQQLPFNQTDILISLCFFPLFIKILLSGKLSFLKTKLDPWIVFMLILYFITGFTSISHRGYQGFLKYGETIAIFYLTVYFIRSKEIKLSHIVKFIVFIGLFQACYGILQSLTGSFGANFQDNRGYLGYLGIGSTLVWHGRGTFGHFNALGPFLSSIFLFYLPINHYFVKNKKRGNIILFILLFGVITSYSRGSLMGLILGFMFFIYQTQKNKIKFVLSASPILVLILILGKFLSSTSYVTTISSRSDMWTIASAAITSNMQALLFGSGLKSYGDAVSPYIPGNILPAYYNNFQAHNFILNYVVEMGILGAAMIVLFLIYNLIIGYSNSKDNNNNKISMTLSSSISIIIVAFFLEGMFDTAFNMFVTQIWFYLYLGLMYAKLPAVSLYSVEKKYSWSH